MTIDFFFLYFSFPCIHNAKQQLNLPILSTHIKLCYARTLYHYCSNQKTNYFLLFRYLEILFHYSFSGHRKPLCTTAHNLTNKMLAFTCWWKYDWGWREDRKQRDGKSSFFFSSKKLHQSFFDCIGYYQTVTA